MKISILILFLVLIGSPSFAQTGSEKFQRDQPVEVVADRLEAEDITGRVNFIGRVVATQGDLTIYSSRMTLFLHPEDRDVERVEAFGEVRIVQGDRVATAQQGVFFRNEARIVLTGEPRVHQGEDFIAGEEIIVYLEEERSVVRGSENARVRATFHPKGERR
jgi:lipopolysaccharide export system protein LptA